MKQVKKNISRVFIGPLVTKREENETIEDYRARRNFNNKHLRAYLRGYQQFRHGYEESAEHPGMRTPAYYDVLAEIKPKDKTYKPDKHKGHIL